MAIEEENLEEVELNSDISSEASLMDLSNEVINFQIMLKYIEGYYTKR